MSFGDILFIEVCPLFHVPVIVPVLCRFMAAGMAARSAASGLDKKLRLRTSLSCPRSIIFSGNG